MADVNGSATTAAQDDAESLARKIACLTETILRKTPRDTQSFNQCFEERVKTDYQQISNPTWRELLVARDVVERALREDAYSCVLYVEQSRVYSLLHYPDLAVGAAYKALLLLDAVSDDSDEYHEVADLAFTEAMYNLAQSNDHEPLENETLEKDTQLHTYRLTIYTLLANNLSQCACIKSAHFYCTRGLELDPSDSNLIQLQHEIDEALQRYFQQTGIEERDDQTKWPDSGMVRREKYPWNTYEPDRLNDIDILNEMMQQVAPALEVKATRLPALTSSSGQSEDSIQLGVFAKRDLPPGEVILNETSLLTANNKLQDALCDACSIELPELDDPASTEVMTCTTCEVVFCSKKCNDMALESYHGALCDKEVEMIAKDVEPEEAADSLYSLLLLRALAMSETQQCHPLDLKELKYIWGDFNEVPAGSTEDKDIPKSLPFSFKHNITLPLHMLEKMDVDIFATPGYDIWVFNTLYAKFRGTASARLSGLGGRAIRGPEVCAVHPMWCLANHSCDPNVSWEWGGEVSFKVRESRVEWQGEENARHNTPGVKKGEEILNHYCDLNLPVQERRAWARGALGGDCKCERCVWEAKQLKR